MIATEQEMLLFLTWKRDWFKGLNLTNHEAYRIKDNIRRQNIGRKRSAEILTAFGCVMIRDEIVFPSIWEKRNDIGSSTSLLNVIMSKYRWYRPAKMKGANASDLKTSFKHGHLSEEKVALILGSYRYKMVRPKETFPAIWELPPAFYESISEIDRRVLSRVIYNVEEV